MFQKRSTPARPEALPCHNSLSSWAASLSPFSVLLLLSCLGLGLSTPLPAYSKDSLREQTCRFCSSTLLSPSSTPASPLPFDSPQRLQYAPDRRTGLVHLALDLTPDFTHHTLSGTATFRLKPQGTPLQELRLDAVDLSVLSTSSSEPHTETHITEREIVFTFFPPIPVGKETTLRISYTAEPKRGLYFRTQAMGYRDTHLWTQGEPIEARHWFPCPDHPSEKFTSELTCHVPPGLIALSNGRLLETKDAPNGLRTFHWLQDKPHSTYLISLVAGAFAKVEDRHRDVPLEFWTPQSELPQAPYSFEPTRRILEFFEKEIGVPYPWAKYSQVAVEDYHWGGMENTSLTTLNSNTLHTPETETLVRSDILVAHELAHQWFGDLVTCKDWSHLWLNEGFATFYDWLWQGELGGENESRLARFQAAKLILNKSQESKAVVWRKFQDPGEMFGYLTYPKGAWILQMLRAELGAGPFRTAIQTYLTRYAYQSVTTEQFRAVLEEVSGRSLDRFFDQWAYSIGTPSLAVTYTWDAKERLARVSIQQTHPLSEHSPLYRFPLTLRFRNGNQNTDRTVQISQKEETFSFPLKNAPEILRIDPDLSLLAKIQFTPPNPMLLAMLADSSDLLGQLIALDHLSEKPTLSTISKLQDALQNAPHYAVRSKAAEALQQAHTPEALAALLASTHQPDARARQALVKAIGGYFTPLAQSSLEHMLSIEKNPAILATILRSLGPSPDHAVGPKITAFLQTPSYRDRIAAGAIEALRIRDDPSLHPPLQAAIHQYASTWTSDTLANALRTLAHLQRNELHRDSTRTLLISFLDHPKETIRLAAISALGTLLDPRAIPLLEPLASLAPTRPEKAVAEAALETLRSQRKPSEELQALRSEFTQLQNAHQELKKDLQTLQKQTATRKP